MLQEVSFSVRRAEVLGLIGPNGSGKTTLFECLAGLIPVESGSVEFQDQPVAPAHRKQVLFYLPDAIRPWADQPVGWLLDFFENVAQPLRLPRRDSSRRLLENCPEDSTRVSSRQTESLRHSEVEYLTRTLKLESLLKARVGSLSKGELKRTLLALGLLTPHPLLLLDEPFDGLDFRQARDVMALLRTYPAKGRTLFLSIHQLADASRVCDRLVLLNKGQVAGEGTLDELQKRAGLTEGGLEEVFLALTN